MVKKLRICSGVLNEYRRVTNGQTEGRTDILRRHSPRYAYASRGKNGVVFKVHYNSFVYKNL